MTIEQAAHAVMMSVDPLGTALGVLPLLEGFPHGSSATAEPRSGFDQRDIVTAAQQLPRRSQPGEPAADDDDLQGRTQPPASVDAICDEESPDRLSTE
jgi:hypothetical protein